MNASATLAFPQMFLVWTLLGVLVAWMFLCLFLALRPLQTRKKEAMDLPTPSGAFPAIVSPLPLRLASVPADKPFPNVPVVSPEPAGDVSSAQVV